MPPLLGLSGVLNAAFIGQLGNSMGFNATAPFVIWSLTLALLAAQREKRANYWIGSGILMGLALGCKLTNAPYTLALGCAALVAPGAFKERLRGASILTVTVIAVYALVAGPWLYAVGKQFGNPFFPMLNQWFHSQ